MSDIEYECALSGTPSPAGPESDSDGLGDLPVGWTRVSISRRRYNPEWVALQQIKQSMLQSALSQLPPEMREFQQYVLSLQIQAQFHAMEQDTPQFVSDVDEVLFLSGSEDIADEVNELRELLGLDAIQPPQEEVGLFGRPDDDEPEEGEGLVGDTDDDDEEDDESDDFDEDDDDDDE